MSPLRRLAATLRSRPMLADGILAGALAALAAVEVVFRLPGLLPDEPLVAAGLLAGAIGSTVPMVWRRRFPLCAAAVVIASTFIPPTSAVGFALGSLIGLYSATAHFRRSWQAGVVATIAVVPIAAATGSGLQAGDPDAVAVGIGLGLIYAVPIVAGVIVRTVRARRRRFVVRAAQAARQAVFDERVRIARELHDVVAHHVSLMGLQAGAARMVIGAEDEQAARALAAIEESSRHAVTELHHMLGALRSDGEPVDPAREPGLDQVPELIAKAGRSSFDVEGEPRSVPRTVDVSAYRVVQEALTNSIKHSGGGTARVLLRYGAGTLEIDIVDNGTGTAPKLKNGIGGHGLIGMRERVALHGGELRAGPRPAGGFGVNAVFPLEEVSV